MINTMAKVGELGVSFRGAIVRAYWSGKGHGSVVKQHDVPKLTVQNIINKICED
jgi:hypothetical protein